MGKMMAMFRKDDVAATLDKIEKKRMINKLHVSYYDGKFDVGSDKVWDTWQIEGPNMVWYSDGHELTRRYECVVRDIRDKEARRLDAIRSAIREGGGC